MSAYMTDSERRWFKRALARETHRIRAAVRRRRREILRKARERGRGP
jgi:hypothetical protein